MIAVKGARVIDCLSEQPLTEGAVLVEGERIQEVGKASELEIPPEAEVIDVGDATILPGLIDCHEHLGIVPGIGIRTGSDAIAGNRHMLSHGPQCSSGFEIRHDHRAHGRR